MEDEDEDEDEEDDAAAEDDDNVRRGSSVLEGLPWLSMSDIMRVACVRPSSRASAACVSAACFTLRLGAMLFDDASAIEKSRCCAAIVLAEDPS